jgi:hypothetical protein
METANTNSIKSDIKIVVGVPHDANEVVDITDLQRLRPTRHEYRSGDRFIDFLWLNPVYEEVLYDLRAR